MDKKLKIVIADDSTEFGVNCANDNVDNNRKKKKVIFLIVYKI